MELNGVMLMYILYIMYDMNFHQEQVAEPKSANFGMYMHVDIVSLHINFYLNHQCP